MDEELWQRKRAEWEAFVATPIGKAFIRFDHAHALLWQLDGQEHVSDRRLDEAWEREVQARKEFIAILQDAALIMGK